MIITSITENFNRDRTVQFKQIHSDPLIRMKKYDEAYTLIGPSLDHRGNPVTGLTEDFTPSRVGGKVQKKVVGTRTIMERELDMEEGSLKQKSPFWSNYQVRIGSSTIKMDLRDPSDLLQYLFLMAQSNVADGFGEMEKSSKIEFVMFSEEDEAKAKVLGRRTLKDAYRLSDKLDAETKVHILAVHGHIVDASSINTIENKIDEIIENNPAEFIAQCEDDILIYKSLVTMCLDKGILLMKEGAVFHNEVNVGFSKDNAAAIVAKNQTLQAVLKAKLSGNMDLIKEAILESQNK